MSNLSIKDIARTFKGLFKVIMYDRKYYLEFMDKSISESRFSLSVIFTTTDYATYIYTLNENMPVQNIIVKLELNSIDTNQAVGGEVYTMNRLIPEDACVDLFKRNMDVIIIDKSRKETYMDKVGILRKATLKELIYD